MPELQTARNVDLYRSRCSDEIMAAALSPQYGGRKEWPHRSLPATPAVQLRLIG